jgi:DNA invertase Pin-like site-specific DNA recombinase
MIIHYLRVSTEEQNLERQMSDSGKELITGAQRFKEKNSGRIPFAERDKGKQIIELVKEGKIKEVHVHSIDRLGRNTSDVLNTVRLFTENGVNLITRQEGLRTLNEDGTENPMASLIVGIMSTLAEWDFNRRRQNQLEGIEVAKVKGKYKGRKVGSEETNEKVLRKYRKIVKTLEAKNSLRDTAKLCEVSLSTVQKVKRIAESEGVL